MLQALGVLGGLAQGWQQGKDDRRRRNLQNLQAESHELRNEGMRMDNRFSRDTLDTRIDREHQSTRQTTANADRSELQRDREALALKLDGSLYDINIATAESNAARASWQATTAANNAGISALNYQQTAALQDSNIQAGLAQNQATISQSQMQQREYNQQTMVDTLTPAFSGAPSIDHFFAHPDVVTATDRMLERSYGDEFHESFGEGARFAGMMRNGDGTVTIGVDTTGDGEADVDALRVDELEYFQRMFGGEQGQAIYAELSARGDQTNAVFEQGQQRADDATQALDDLNNQIPQMENERETVDHFRRELSQLNKVRQELTPPGSVQDDGTGISGPAGQTREGQAQLEAINQQIGNIYEAAEALGFDPEDLTDESHAQSQASLAHLSKEQERLEQELANIPQQVSNNLSNLGEGYRRGLTAGQVDENRKEANDQTQNFVLDATGEVDVSNIFTTDFGDGPQNDVRGAEVAKHEFQAFALDNPEYFEPLAQQGARGATVVRTLLTRSSEVASRLRIPIRDALSAMTAEHPAHAEELLQFRADMERDGAFRNYGGRSVDYYDAASQEYAKLRANGHSPERSKRLAIQHATAQ